MDDLLGQHYRLIRKIGKGSFGEIYQGYNTQSNENVAIKLELSSTAHPQLQYESRIYRILEGSPGIPKLYQYGSTSTHNYLVIDLLGPSLEDLLHLCNRKLSLKSLLMLADQLLTLIETIHSKNFLHRDVKPENFLVGTGSQSNKVYAVDFGLAKRFRDSRTLLHAPYREGKKLTGTARYASIYTHLGFEQSRRDDLESLGYMLVYLFKGKLPWQGVVGESKEEKYINILEKKVSVSVENLCLGMPEEFKEFFVHVKSIKFEESPDYGYLKRLFNNVFARQGYANDAIFDWIRIPSRKDSLNPEDYNRPMKSIDFLEEAKA